MHWQKHFVTLIGFCLLRGCEGGWVNQLKTENLSRKSFFSDNVEWSSKNMWKISADVKANKKTRNKRSSDTVSYEFIYI